MEDADKVAFEEMKKMSAQGIYPHEKESLEHMKHRLIAVKVAVMIPEKAEVKPLNWNVEVMNKRGRSVTLSDWTVEETPVSETEKQRVLSFMVSMRLPDAVPLPFDGITVCSFADLCWFQGNEAIPKGHVPDVNTKIQTNYPSGYGDIGWYLPCRFADRLIDAIGKANDFFLSGILEDALIYGPFYQQSR